MNKFFRTMKKIHKENIKANNRVERERKRQTRETAQYYKKLQQQNEIEEAEDAVTQWNQYVDLLTSLHKTCSETIDWNAFKNIPEPQKVMLSTQYVDSAQKVFDDYKPGFIDKLFKRVKKQTQYLENNIKQAKDKDLQGYNRALETYESEYKDWLFTQEIADGVLNNDYSSYLAALEYFEPFSEISELGTHLQIKISENMLDIDLHINSDELIPNFVLSQTKTGKLSKKNMSKTMFNELYQDYVCSAILRVAREVFAHLPIKIFRVNAIAQIINSHTGHLEDSSIVSAIVSSSTLQTLNLQLIDPSDSMKNFVHSMNFKKTQGFTPIDKVHFKNFE